MSLTKIQPRPPRSHRSALSLNNRDGPRGDLKMTLRKVSGSNAALVPGDKNTDKKVSFEKGELFCSRKNPERSSTNRAADSSD